MSPRYFWMLLAVVSLPITQAAADDVDFSRDVLPILSNKCFVCHGPDTHDADMLRLDTAAGATAMRFGGRAIDPQHPDDSLALARLQSSDDPMPPADAEKQLTDAERETLIQWIRGGGEYGVHWAFEPPQKLTPPGLDANAPRAVIDELVERQLQAQHQDPALKLAASAARTTLARRVALVLTGLPPEPAQLEAFLTDESDGAYERFVDRMLASNRFGEHQARYWLDAVRYGDTHGLHLDNRRGIYPYRDWVVRAFNENLPLDTFLTWQLAGDLLPDPSMEQLTATGFVRMNPTTSEGGAIPAEFQAKNNFDRVETLGTVLLGMTLTCSRCHSHKYDPISQTEYYRLLAFFNSTAESAMDGNKYEYGPTLRVPADYDAWGQWRRLVSRREKLLNHAKLAAVAEAAETAAYAKAAADFDTTDWRWLRFKGDPPAAKPWEDAEPIADLPGASKTKLPNAKAQEQGTWVSFRLNTKVRQTLKLHFNGDARSELSLHDKSGARPIDWSPSDGLQQTAALGLAPGEREVRLRIRGAAGQPIRVELTSPWSGWSPATDADAMLAAVADPRGPFASLGRSAEATALAAEIKAARQQFTTTLVARELPKPRVTKVLRRGEYDQPQGDPLEPGVLSVMGELPPDAPRNRLGLAQWLTSRDHPLVARVLVNRLWQRVFGNGLVRSPEDFGSQGRQPTHPQLLDWLAVELHDSGWDQKRLLREMVLSDVFRQSSATRDQITDPENLWLSRGPGYRLDAEVLRDVGLWASGLLDPHMGGEGVKPYQPPGMWKALAHPASNTKQYVRDEGRRIYRRSLYVYWKRTSPHPMMTLFDAPDRESSCVRRSRTNTALQSLGLLNETQRVEMARCFAERLLTNDDEDADRVHAMFRLLACRDARDGELAACLELLRSMRQRYEAKPADAESLLKTGDAKRDDSLDAAEHAAWTLVTSTLLASDLALTLY